jgi:hypothetical protein
MLKVAMSSQSRFTTGGLPPVSSFWLQAPWDSRPVIFFLQLNTCCQSPYVTSSLTRGWLCRSQLLLVLASADIRRSKSRRTHNHILLSQIWDSPNLEGQVPHIYNPQGQGGPVIPPGTGFTFHHHLQLTGLRWRYSTPSIYWSDMKEICFGLLMPYGSRFLLV